MRYSPFRHAGSILRKARPIHLTFFLTRRCNSRCPFCFYLRSGDSSEAGQELTLGEIERVSGSLGSLLWLAFSGGEIFLRTDLAEISRIFYRRNRPAIMLFPTNGMMPDLIAAVMEKVLESCPKSTIAVKLSLDGLGEAHDAIRNTPGSYERVMETYGKLKRLSDRFPNFELGINTVFCAGNQDAMDGIIDFVLSMDGIRTHTISLVRGNLRESSHKEVDMTRYRRAIGRLEANLKNRTGPVYRFRGGKLKAAQDILQRRIIARTMDEDRMIIPCFAGKLNLVLHEDGALFPCEILDQKLGNVRDFGCSIPGLLATERAKRIIGDISARHCHCTHECYSMTNILFNPACYPALLREYVQL
ncbi:MAG: hypothetical protein OHK006_11370 [Thermodesulfovibrionales bacterium]